MLKEHTQPSVEPKRHRPLALPQVLRWFWIASLVAFALMFLIAYLEARAGIPLRTRGPFPDPLFGDLLEYLPVFKLIHTPAFFTGAGQHVIAYPPLGAAVFALLYSFHHPVPFYLSVLAVWLVVSLWGISRALIANGLATWVAVLFPVTVAICSFPIEGLIQRGNIELFVWITVSIGIWMIFRGQQYAAAILWGLAAGIKLYPVLLFAVFLRKQGLRALLIACGTFLLSTIAAMRFLVPDLRLAFHHSTAAVSGYQGLRSSMWNLHEVAVNHSLFVWFKLFGGFSTDPAKITRVYFISGAVLFLLAYFGRARKLPLLNQLIVLTAFMVLLPSVSYFYTLTNLYAPWLALVVLCIAAERQHLVVPGLRSAILLFLPVFASFTLFTFRKVYLFGGMLQSVILLCIIISALQHPFELPQLHMTATPNRNSGWPILRRSRRVGYRSR